MTDDGFNIGILYRGGREPFAPQIGQRHGDVAELEKQFAL
jgi:2-oxoglutarate ferredoxin oxidoreductase subunit beta